MPDNATPLQPTDRTGLVVSDGEAATVVETLQNAARTGSIGDGKIFVLDVAQAVRIRTGDADDDAL